ncbi:DUF7108 family protein [Halocatena pleomorpha]|uniref:RnhA operon protein n=1 Tax=Halocatena pleomorpha TaxID=1785090 RepID=A0A3P3R5Y4_9EURY|nr:rnhA operon protein [Halocatena pleomorpha]RRJ28867.1 rnhA operon protein [Halocatena pleomorpha]
MLPDDIADEAERLTRLARAAIDSDEADAARTTRDDLLARHGYIAREREPDATLVCFPDDWVADGTVQTERIDDTDRAIERPLEAPATDEWEEVHQHNRDVAARVTERYGDSHGANAAAFSEFMSNHYAMAIEHATEAMREEFLTEYYPRNVWPTKKQRAVIEKSVDLALDLARE